MAVVMDQSSQSMHVYKRTLEEPNRGAQQDCIGGEACRFGTMSQVR